MSRVLGVIPKDANQYWHDDATIRDHAVYQLSHWLLTVLCCLPKCSIISDVVCLCVYDRETSDRSLRDKAAEHITRAFPTHSQFYPENLLIATWNEVGYYDSQNDRVGLFIMHAAILCFIIQRYYVLDRTDINSYRRYVCSEESSFILTSTIHEWLTAPNFKLLTLYSAKAIVVPHRIILS